MITTKKMNKTKSNFNDKFHNLDLSLHGVRLPSFEINKKYKRKASVSEDATNEEFLKALCNKGFKALGIKSKEKKKLYSDRARYELEIISELGFVDYILLVWDVINFCKENDIPTGFGRGSAAGSLILYLIGVTGIDPIEHDLFFERFISKTRAKKQIVDGITYLDGSLMCDIDLDICYYNRHKVLDYLRDKFKGNTCKIVTLNSLTSKLLIKECGKIVAGQTEQEMDIISSLIPKVFGQVKDIEETYEEVPEFRDWCDGNPQAYKIALKLKNLVKNKSVHASAVSLSYDKLEDCCPVELTSDKNSIISSYDMNWVSIFNVKLDILGLRSVSVVDDACKNIGIKPSDIDFNDNFIYQKLFDLKHPHGLFQIEADTNFRVCQKVKPKNLNELSAVLALARPGALAFVDQYANYTNNDVYEPIHPFFDDVLKETGGVALYQEQLMKMAHKVGFTLDEAEILRRIVGKKKVSEVRKWKKKIKDKIKDQGLDKEIGDILWAILEDSANYSFNKSHSISYAALAAATVYLKFKYPQAFFLSLLKMTRHEPDPIMEISKIQTEMAAFGIKLLPPHIVKSNMDFTLEGNDIRFGLLSIKGISDKSIEKLNNFKNEYSGKFEVFEGAKESGLGIGALCALIQAGAFTGYRQSRSKIVYEAQLWNILTAKEKRFVMELAEENEHDLVKILKLLKDKKNEKGKPLIRESRFGTISKRTAEKGYKKIYELNSQSESFANWFYEKSLLGYTYGTTLKDIFKEKRRELLYINEIEELPMDSRIVFIGRVEGKPYNGVSKTAKRSQYLKLDVADETGKMKVMIFNQRKDQCKEMNNGFPEDKSIVIVKGIKKEGTIFADIIAVQNNKIYTKLSELKGEK